jgi:transposase InsO family protein
VGAGSWGLRRLVRAPGDRHARHGGALASVGLASVLALESHSRGGRPHLTPEVQGLIMTMSRENPTVGHRAHQRRTAQARHCCQQPLDSTLSLTRTRPRASTDLSHIPAQPFPPSVGGRSVHRTHVDVQDAVDAGLHRPWAARAGAHQRDGNPTAAWVWRQLIEATPWGQKPRHLLRDHDAVYGRDFRQRARRIGIDAIATPVASPRANAIVERVIGTLRRECLDHLIVSNEEHLRSVLTEFVQYYNRERPHQ